MARPTTARVALAFSMLFLLVGAFTTVKTARDALFLARFPVRRLSLVAIGLAALTGAVVSVYLRATARVPRVRLVAGTNAVVAVTLVGLWLALRDPRAGGWLAWVLYVWSSLYGVFTVMQFWLLASDLFDAREARKHFGFVSAGGTVGGLAGGLAASTLAGTYGTRALLLVCAAGALGVAALALAARRHAAPAAPRPALAPAPEGEGALGVVVGHPYVRLIASALFLSTLATTLLDLQFKAIARAHFHGHADAMAAYFGTLSATLSVASIALQVGVTGWVLRRFGIGVGLLALPAAVLAGAGAVAGHPALGVSVLGAASFARVTEGGVRFAVDRSSSELMWLPLPERVKAAAKPFVDTVVDRAATGAAGLLWLAVAALGLDRPHRVRGVAVLVLAVAGAWLWVVRRARRGYVDTLGETLGSAAPDLERLAGAPLDAEAVGALERALTHGDARAVRFALYVLAARPGALRGLDALLAHADPDVRVEALRAATERDDRTHRGAAARCLGDPSVAVREAAVAYLVATAPHGDDPDLAAVTPATPAARLALEAARLGSPVTAIDAAEALRAGLATVDPLTRAQAVRLLGGAPPDLAAALLAGPLRSGEPAVVDAALRAAGRARARRLAPVITELLAVQRFRPRATEALVALGPDAHDHLRAELARAGAPEAARVAVARVLGARGDARAAPDLAAGLQDPSEEVVDACAHALGRLAAAAPVALDRGPLAARLARDTEALYRALLYLGQGSWPDARAAALPKDLLARALREHADRCADRALTLVALMHPGRDVAAACRGLRRPARAIRASSLELLDNLLPEGAKRTLFPLFEPASPAAFALAAREATGLAPEDRVALVRRLLLTGRGWLRTVAAYTAGAEKMGAVGLELAGLPDDGGLGPVRDRCLAGLQSRDGEEAGMGLTVVEKALKLQAVDVLKRASSEDLAHVAQIAEEAELAAGTRIYAEGDAPDALFVVVSGGVRLHRGAEEIALLGPGEAFGTWALLDDAPRVTSATTSEATRLLRVEREQFLALLADRMDIVQAVFKAMVERLRRLADVARGA